MHYNDVIMGTMTPQITSLAIVYSTVYSGAGQRKHQSSASLAFVRGIHRWIPHTNGQLREKVSIWWRHHGNRWPVMPIAQLDDLSVQISETRLYIMHYTKYTHDWCFGIFCAVIVHFSRIHLGDFTGTRVIFRIIQFPVKQPLSLWVSSSQESSKD